MKCCALIRKKQTNKKKENKKSKEKEEGLGKEKGKERVIRKGKKKHKFHYKAR